MKTALIILYIAVFVLLAVSVMQWFQIKNLNSVAVSKDKDGNTDLTESSFGDMITALKKNVKEVDLKF